MEKEFLEDLKSKMKKFIDKISSIQKSVSVLKIAELGYACKADEDYTLYYHLLNCEKNLKALHLQCDSFLDKIIDEDNMIKLFNVINEIDTLNSIIESQLSLYNEERQKEVNLYEQTTIFNVDPSFFSERNRKDFLNEMLEFGKHLYEQSDSESLSEIFRTLRDKAVEQEELALTEN